jgi:hypothetical protein
MATPPTAKWGIPLWGKLDTIPSLEGVLNAQSNALDAALTTASKGFYLQYATRSAMNLNTTATKWQHATVTNDSVAVNNGDYIWNGSAWVNVNTTVNGTFSMQGIYKLGSPAAVIYSQNGRVYMEGMMSNTSTAFFTAGTPYTLATIDSALAPAIDLWFPLNWGSDGTGGINVTTAGAVIFQLSDDAGSLSANVLRVSLSGASWRMKGV